MKKILFVIQSLRIGGAEKEQVTLANRLVEAGYDVTILLWMPYFDLQNELDERVHVIYKPQDQHLGNKIPYIRHKYYDDVMWLLRAKPAQLYRYYVGRENYDIEIAFFHSWAVNIVSGSTNKKAVHIAWIHRDIKTNPDQTEITPEMREMYKNFDHIVCVSKAAYDSYIEMIGDTGNVQTIYNLIPIDQVLELAEKQPPVKVERSSFHAVMVGRLTHAKGYDRLIRVVVALRNEGKDISLTLVGAEDPQPALDMIAENSAGSYISLIHNDKNPFPYIKGSDLLVCPSHSEGYNLTVAEALILGVPVLSTDCSGPVEILDGGKYGMIVENSEEGLYRGLKQLYEDRALLEEYRKKAIERRGFFDEEKIFKQITDLFEQEKES